MIVVLETKIYIYDIAHMKLLETLSTESNQKGTRKQECRGLLWLDGFRLVGPGGLAAAVAVAGYG